MTGKEEIIGVAALKEAVTRLPKTPGVYRMLARDGTILYIGKAKALKHRVSQYTQVARLSHRIGQMVAQIARVEVTTTASEAEALLLEANLIKHHRPRYNILLKDDKSFPYIMISTGHDYPRITKFRGKERKEHRYFGPYSSASAANKAIIEIQKAFRLRPCSDSQFKGRTRPCLEYQIKRCSAPCVGLVPDDDYATSVKEAVDFLSGKSRDVQQSLEAQMLTASEAMQFEQAAIYRDRLQALDAIQQRQAIHAKHVDDADVIALLQEGGISCVHMLFIRGGNMLGSRSFFPQADAEESPEAILAAFLGYFYENSPVPKQIMLSQDVHERDVLTEALAQRRDGKVELLVPQRGEKRLVIEMALANAEQSLKERQHQTMKTTALHTEMAEAFDLELPLRRIDVFDNSHLFGQHAVGAMIVAGEDGFIKNEYRKYTVDSGEKAGGGDDYAMLREVISRRYRGIAAGEERADINGIPDRPDMVLIDGGEGHLTAAMQAMDALALQDLPLVCIAKGVDRNAGKEFYHRPNHQPIQLQHGSPLAHYVQRLRDEAHRFAIGSYRKKHEASLGRSVLDDIPGLGPVRKRRLLAAFGSPKAIATADIAELRKVDGISEALAEKIVAYLTG